VVLAQTTVGWALALATASSGTGSSPGLPASVVTPLNAHSVRYCVSSYAPNAVVAVRDERTGRTVTIHTNHLGSGCTDLPVAAICGSASIQTIVATGTGADGNPATSRASDTGPRAQVGCAGEREGAEPGRAQPGSEAALLAVLGAIVGLGAAGVVVWRRRLRRTGMTGDTIA
jgi:hypothetical protein